MRRLWYWYVPLIAAVAAAVTFGIGFYSFLHGDTGAPVNVTTAARLDASPVRGVVAPLVIGDSLARGTGDESGLGIGGRLVEELRRRRVPVKNAVNIAVNGARTRDILEQLRSRNVRTLVAESNAIIISAGGNDLWGDNNFRNAPPPDPQRVMDEVLGRVADIVRTVRETNPTARIFVVGLYNPFGTSPFGRLITPFVNRWNAKLIERFAGDPNVVVVQTSDLFAYHDRLSLDRFHPGDEGYALIARRIADAI